MDYVWQDGLLTHQSMTYYFHVTLNGTEKVVELPFTAKFVYDESNTPVGCLVNDEMALAFVRNLQGDIIAVVNQEGTALLEYSYDPWGKVTITQNGENLTEQERQIIAVLCPFAYRGYNYDYTTGLYYLQSRYYNPEWGRFLNVDDTNILLATQGENLGANLFAYCNNNPVNKADYTGKKAKTADALLFEYTMYAAAGISEIERFGYLEWFDDEVMAFTYRYDKYGLCHLRFAFKRGWSYLRPTYRICTLVIGTLSSWGKLAGQHRELTSSSSDAIWSALDKGAAQTFSYDNPFPEGDPWHSIKTITNTISGYSSYFFEIRDAISEREYVYPYFRLINRYYNYKGISVLYKPDEVSGFGAWRTNTYISPSVQRYDNILKYRGVF